MNATDKHKLSRIKHGNLNLPRKQAGYIIVVTIILLGAMLLATLNYFEHSADSMQMSGYNRDASEALLLAESAMNMLYGQFIFGHDIDNTDNTNSADKDQVFDDSVPENLPLHYMYFVGDDNTIDAIQPSILQSIANGEARSGSHTAVAVSNHRVPDTATRLLVSELYTNNNTLKPVLYTLDNNNELQINTVDTWTSIFNSTDRAAVAWLELTRTDATDNTLRIFVQAAARIGDSRNYVQRFVGIYPNNLGPLGAANESSP